MKPSRTIQWVLFGIIVFGFAGWITTGITLYAKIAYLGLALVAVAGIWATFSMHGIKLTRKARTLRASMGDVFEELFEIHNTAWTSCLWLEIINQSNLPKAGGSRLLTSIGRHQRRFYTARTVLYQRGSFPLGPTRLSSGDPFGLFTIRRKIKEQDSLIVLPMTLPITNFPPPPGLLPGGRAIRQRTLEITPHAGGVREYAPGDPMKRIHWPTSAHRGRFMVKEFEQDPQADIWLFVDAQKDVQASVQLPSEEVHEDEWWLRRAVVKLPCDTFEYVICSAASLANHFLTERHAVGLACITGRTIIVSPERGDRQVHKIMETLAFLQPIGKMPLYGLVNIMAGLLPIGTGVILITPSQRSEILLTVDELQRRSLCPIVVLLDRNSFIGLEKREFLYDRLAERNIPVCKIKYGDDLSHQLSLTSAYYKKPNMNFQKPTYTNL